VQWPSQQWSQPLRSWTEGLAPTAFRFTVGHQILAREHNFRGNVMRGRELMFHRNCWYVSSRKSSHVAIRKGATGVIPFCLVASAPGRTRCQAQPVSFLLRVCVAAVNMLPSIVGCFVLPASPQRPHLLRAAIHVEWISGYLGNITHHDAQPLTDVLGRRPGYIVATLEQAAAGKPPARGSCREAAGVPKWPRLNLEDWAMLGRASTTSSFGVPAVVPSSCRLPAG
jgi:hypothetical protein